VKQVADLPFGGEIYPTTAQQSGILQSGAPAGQDFATCAKATHASWLGDWKLFTPGAVTGTALASAKAGAQLLGYEFFVASYETLNNASRTQTTADVTLKNTGIAPFITITRHGPFSWPRSRVGRLSNMVDPVVLDGHPSRRLGSTAGGAAAESPHWVLHLADEGGEPNDRRQATAVCQHHAGPDRGGAGWLTLGVVPAL